MVGRAEPAIRVTNVFRRFGSTTALDGVSLAIERGEIHALRAQRRR